MLHILLSCKYKNPSESTLPRSPVRTHPSRVIVFAVAAIQHVLDRGLRGKYNWRHNSRTCIFPVTFHDVRASPTLHVSRRKALSLSEGNSQPDFANPSRWNRDAVVHDDHVIDGARSAAVREKMNVNSGIPSGLRWLRTRWSDELRSLPRLFQEQWSLSRSFRTPGFCKK